MQKTRRNGDIAKFFGMSFYVLNKNNYPIPEPDSLEWSQWMSQHQINVELTEVGHSQILTMFLGIDHNFGEGAPLLWETMIFGGEYDLEMQRYSALEDAKRGHDEMIGKVTRHKLSRTPIILLSDCY